MKKYWANFSKISYEEIKWNDLNLSCYILILVILWYKSLFSVLYIGRIISCFLTSYSLRFDQQLEYSDEFAFDSADSKSIRELMNKNYLKMSLESRKEN